MTTEGRPDPDALLRAIHRDQEKNQGGQLRVFLGMSAGVGKTFAMLKAAKSRLAEGADVLIGIVETHGRKETEALLEGLPILPRTKVDYKGVVLEELDLDEILRRRPQLVLVDELAHSNVPGSRHPKRYQDVLELLDAGIHVFTTINVQHLESRKDLVERIVDVQIRETVPDSILERANQIEVIDITPSELLKRLREGKVYLGDNAHRAAANFFKEGSLTALREIALRFTAEKVDHELQRFHETNQTSAAWQTNERLMVAVSHSPYSDRLIRATRRLAFNLEASWIAVHVDTGLKLNDGDQQQLAKNLNLARELNADVISTSDTDLAEALKRIARQKNVTQIVVGRPTRRMIRDFVEGGTLLDRLVRESWDVDVHVIRQSSAPLFRGSRIPKLNFESGLVPYWNTFWLIGIVSIVSGVLEPLLGYRAVGFVFLLPILFVGRVGYMGPVIFAASLSALIWNFFFIHPILTFAISEPADVIMCMTYFTVAVITGMMTSRIRKHEEIMREREERTNVLYEVLRDISSSHGKSEFLKKVTRRVGQVLRGSCGVLLKEQGGTLVFHEKDYTLALPEKERAVAQWAFEKKQTAGWSTHTLSQSSALFVPIEGENEVLGVFAFTPNSKTRPLSKEQEDLLYSICRQLGLSLERHFIERRLRESEKLEESEKLHQTLLNSISHEMRTPLTAIMGSAALLTDEQTPTNRETQLTIGRELSIASDRLNRVIENLLDMSRLNSGTFGIKKEWHDVHDLIGVTIKRLGHNLNHHRLRTHLPESLPLLEIDFRLFEHAISNLILNATLYSPLETEIILSVSVENEKLCFTIDDSGPGIPQADHERIFEKFYRVPGSPPGGTGLGLSIAKSIVDLHRGEIRVENRASGGARFIIELPVGQPPGVPDEPAS